ncbi:MAG: TIM44-like domain-containing protein, partial [Bacteroidetes bacterium]|nr:TIM44-like domain-containing protein [Bacteroidota bacterium]
GAIIYLIYWIIRLIFMLPFPINIIVLAIVIFVIYKVSKSYQATSGLNSIPNFSTVNNDIYNKPETLPTTFQTKNPDFNANNFKQKVQTAFVAIQNAWMLQDISKVRKWITDGVYQRFNTQFIMMKAIEQVNEISDINIQQIYIDDVEEDGEYDIIHVGIQYSMYDGFSSKKFKRLNDGGTLHALEYWSFIKKSGVKEKDLYHTTNCPNCGGNLPDDGGETAKCPYCSTITYLGDYDWILAEITQPDDYHNSNKKYEKQGKFSKKIRAQIKEQQSFSLQLLEDKVSNGYMQMMTALMLKKPEIMRRFVADNLYEKLEQRIKSETPFVFNRLYLNHVTAFDYFVQDKQDNIVVALKCSSQKIQQPDSSNLQMEFSISSRDEVVIMSRDVDATKPNGALYAHSCPSCGAPIKDTTEVHCTYCNAVLNSTKFEWIISDWMSASEFEDFKRNNNSAFAIDKSLDDLNELFAVRDFALNNVIMMIAADGRITNQEAKFVETLAKKWNYNLDKIQGFLTMGINNKLVVRMPQDAKQKQKIIKLMEKAAMLDEQLTPEEEQLLQQVKNM